MKRISLFFMLMLLELASYAGDTIPTWDTVSFYRHVLTDNRWHTSDLVVYNVRSWEYSGPVITYGYVVLTNLLENGQIDSTNQINEAIDILLRTDTIELPSEMHRIYSPEIPPDSCALYRYRNEPTEKIIEECFEPDLTMKWSFTYSEQLALVVVLFERRIAIYGDGWGWHIDTYTGSWSDWQETGNVPIWVVFQFITRIQNNMKWP